MDASSDTALSLDELTVEFSEDNNQKPELRFWDYGEKTDQFTSENDSLKIQISDNKDLDVDDIFIAREFIQIDSHDNIPVHDITDLKTLASEESNTFKQSPDFKEDIAILPCFKESKVNTTNDSDSEFEVPDRPVIPQLDNTSVSPADTNAEISINKTIETTHYLKSSQDININVTSIHASKVSSGILPSLDGFSEDYTLFHQNSNILPMSTAQSTFLQSIKSHQTLSEATGVTCTSTNTTCEWVMNDQKSSQSFTPAADSSISGKQYQLSEGVAKQEMTLTAFPTTDVDRTDTEEPSKPRIVTTAEDWEEIDTVEPVFLQSSDTLAGSSPIIESKPLALFADTWTHFETADYSPVKTQIRMQIERHGFSAFKHMLFGPPKMHRDLLPQRELIFCIAATQLDNGNEAHVRVLQSIYRCLTGSKFDCQRFGGHWEEIGFQGRDPATDLRGTGMLALLHLLYLLQSPSTRDLARDIYKLSLHPTQNFPFCLMSINVSRICLQVLREDLFNKECNNRRDVRSTINNVYAALFLRLYRQWKKGKTILDSGFVLQDIETYCRKHSKIVLKDLEAYEKTRKQGLTRKDSDLDLTFYNVCKEDKTDGKSHAELH